MRSIANASMACRKKVMDFVSLLIVCGREA